MANTAKKLITHNGSFHTDDVFAAATLSIMLENKGESFEIIRTRDMDIIKTGDYVFDVGGVYDPERDRFDHHQEGGAGKRNIDGGIEYAAFGLVWQKYGRELCGSEEVATSIDNKLVAPVDAWDNGIDLVQNTHDVTPYYIQNLFFGMEPTWQEEVSVDEMFVRSVAIARGIIEREIIQVRDGLAVREILLDAYQSSEDKRVIVLDRKYPFQYVLSPLPEPLYVVYPRENDGTWGAKAVKAELKSFKNKKDFPAPWAGLRDEELQKASGVADAVFCHRGLFLAVAKSKEGAIKLAELALNNNLEPRA